MGAQMENLQGNHNPLDMSEGDLEGEHVDEVDKDPFHDAGVRGRFEECLAHAIDLNGGIKIEVPDFYEKMHVEGYLDWEASLNNYFEWKTMAEARKVLSVKLKLKGTALQQWKRVEEQHAQQGKAKISTWEHMKAKLRKQFLPPN